MLFSTVFIVLNNPKSYLNDSLKIKNIRSRRPILTWTSRMSNHPGLNEFLVRLHDEHNTSLRKFIIAKLSIRSSDFRQC